MAGRGRGRGRGSTISFNIESLGFGRGEALPSASVEPRQNYPTLEYKAVPLEESDEQKYLLALKQELRSAIRDSPYFIKPLEKRREIERYSDKYQQNTNDASDLKIGWTRFPNELKIKPKKKFRANVKLRLKKKAVVHQNTSEDVEKYLESMDEKEDDGDESADEKKETKKKDEEDDEKEIEEDEIEEEELEDDTDYNMTYFDNGEGADEEDDLDEGATY